MKNTSDFVKQMWRRLTCFFLVMVTVLTLCPVTAFAATTSTRDEGQDTSGRSLGYLNFEATITNGDGKTQPEKKTSSFFAVIMVDQNEKIIQNESAKSVTFNASYNSAESGQPNSDYEVRILYTTDARAKDTPTAKISTGKGTAKGTLNINQNAAETVYYVTALVIHSQTGEIVKRTMISVTTQRLHKRLSNIYYSRVGMQVRVIDDIPFGQYDYKANQATKVKNTAGVAKTSSGTYTGIDGNSYENAYCDIRLSNEGTGASIVAANTDDIQNVIKKMVKGTLMQNGASNNFNAAKGYFEAKGPAYVQCHGVKAKGEPIYNLQYYHATDTSGINSYAGWGQNTRLKDWEGNLRYLSLVIPLSMTGVVTVNYYDEDNPTKKIRESYTTSTKEFQKAISDKNSMETFIMETSAAFTNQYIEAMGGWHVVLSNENVLQDYNSDRQAISATPLYNKDTKTWTMQSSDATAKIKEIMGIRNNTLSSIVANSLTAPYVQTLIVTAPEIKGYTFDFGYGNDALTAMSYGSLMFSVDSKSATVMMTADSPSAVVNLYYKGVGDTTYTVKVRKNGEIDESYTKKYDASVGDRIEKEDVDTSYIPKDWTIKDIENVPLDVVKDPEQNIIIIDCDAPDYIYTVMYYLDGVFKEKTTVNATANSVITTPPIKDYSGYTLSRIDGTPLTIVDSKGVIRVYYVKTSSVVAAPVNAKLFKDEYRTQITKSKSGYGVYGLFYVDVSKYVDAMSHPKWTIENGCGPKGLDKNKDVHTYKDINVTATATWYEGLPIDPNNTKGNKTGHKVTVNLVKDTTRSTEKIWVFRFPQNSQSAKKYAKAYIPIGWKNNTNWTVSFTAKMTAQEYHWTVTPKTVRPCPGHMTLMVLWFHNSYTIYPLKDWYEDYSQTFTGSASIAVNGNMYEDDFTGGKN